MKFILTYRMHFLPAGWLRIRYAAALCWLGVAGVSVAGTLVINANSADPGPRAAWEATVGEFQRANPDIDVELNVYDHESYKKSLRNWLTGRPPDVVFWFAG